MFSVDTLVEQIMQERFAISGVTFSNLEQVYDPLVSGLPSMAEVRSHLTANGMSHSLADSLAIKYLKGLRNKDRATVCAVVDLFSDHAAKKALREAGLPQVALNMVSNVD